MHDGAASVPALEAATKLRRGRIEALLKILAVDDSETYLQALADELRQDNYDVALARSGEEALELLAVEPVDCILLDLMMPGIGGLETCRRLKSVAILRDIPVVMLTAVEDRETMIEGLGAGADDFISKSSDFAVLHARVVAQLRRKQFEDENRRYLSDKRDKLGHRLHHHANQLSGGEKQRIAIARALVGRPTIVFADEPTGALDSKTGDAIVELLRELNESGTTIVVITHDQALAGSFRRSVSVRDGEIIADQTLELA